jgi:LysM repeat protein
MMFRCARSSISTRSTESCPFLGKDSNYRRHVRPERSTDYARMFEHMLGLLHGRLPEWRLRHHVLEGENLWMLSQRYSVPASAIRRTNGLGPQAEIRTGQWIEIPPHELSTGPDQYRIQPGDTLLTIARDHGLAVTHLKQLNQLRRRQPAGARPGDQPW